MRACVSRHRPREDTQKKREKAIERKATYKMVYPTEHKGATKDVPCRSCNRAFLGGRMALWWGDKYRSSYAAK